MSDLIPINEFERAFDEARREITRMGRRQRKVIRGHREETHRKPNGTIIEVTEDVTTLIEETFFGMGGQHE